LATESSAGQSHAPPARVIELYSRDFAAARDRFRAAAREAGAALDAIPLEARGPHGESLSIDVARLGQAGAQRVLLHTSGLHGVEAFAGSAVQIAALKDPPPLPAGCALVLAHVLNPYGMAWLRRTNENNVDLNRNFLSADERRQGAPSLYAALDPLLNPPSPPARDAFWLRLAWLALRHGFKAPRQAIAEGQFEFPLGLFYGGSRLEPGPQAFVDWLRRELEVPSYLFSLDLHSGLGRWGEETPIVATGVGATLTDQLAAALDRRLVDPATNDAVYRIRGGMGAALPRMLPGVRVDAILQEIGTRPAARVLHALRDENRAHHHAGDPFPHPAKLALREALSPSNLAWRERAVALGDSLLRAAARWAFFGK